VTLYNTARSDFIQASRHPIHLISRPSPRNTKGPDRDLPKYLVLKEVIFLPALAFTWAAFLAQVVLTLRFVIFDMGRLRAGHG